MHGERGIVTMSNVWGNEWERLRDEMNRLFERSAFGRGILPGWLGLRGRFGRLNMTETAEARTVECELPGVSTDDVETSILLSVFATEGVHGAAKVRMDGGFLLVEKRRVCVVDATTRVGATIAKIFTAVLLRSFGQDAFEVERIVDDVVPRRTARARR